MISDEKMITEYKLACINYRKKICEKCCNNKQKKIRNCSLLRGFHKPSCRHMSLAIKNRINIKLMNKEYLDNIMDEIIEIRDEAHKGDFRN
jgi:hypothetical protein